MNQTSVFVPILKYDKQDDGTLLVHGVATDSTLDSDKQVCDNDWLKSAMPSWFRWGNIREQHSNIAAGVATEYEEKDGQHWITARVVDPSSVKKVETRTLKGFSIGIHSPRVVRDEKAAGGRIVDGEIVEVSLVDRPANPSCTLSLAKAAGGLEEVLVKREVSAGERSRLADTGDAMPDGSFPIANRSDLKNAILAFGRAKNPAAVRRHIMRRAKELGAENLLPEKWTGRTDKMAEETTGEESTGGAEESSAPPAKKAAKACKECGKPEKACKCSEGGFERKAVEESSQKPGEESSQKPGEESSRPGGVAGVAGKSVTLDDLAAQIIELHILVSGIAEKFAAPEVEKSQSEDITKAVEAIEARVSDIENKAATTVIPARTAVAKAATPNPAVDKAKEYRAKAMATTNPTLAQGYLTLATEIEKSL